MIKPTPINIMTQYNSGTSYNCAEGLGVNASLISAKAIMIAAP
ncbi:hypothetical protein P20652_1015 [Pseudoalteromonas sp. BSi20652]|nr:hypothetical protein P20652_1015 [Pseudoalteromonas sp. BSi20652]